MWLHEILGPDQQSKFWIVGVWLGSHTRSWSTIIKIQYLEGCIHWDFNGLLLVYEF